MKKNHPKVKFAGNSSVRVLPCSENPLNKNSALFTLFQSEYLTLDLLIFYLHKKYDHAGVRTYLINKLYFANEDELSYYIPELCYLTIKQESQELDRFLLDKCTNNLPLYFLINWSIISFGEANLLDKEGYERVKKLSKLSMINAERMDENTQPKFASYERKEDALKYVQIMQDKESRMKYNNTVNKFINNLIKLSLNLKSYKIEDRKEKLKYYINKANNVIEANKKKEISINLSDYNHSIYFNGIAIPFVNIEKSPFHSNLVVRILPHDFTCFNTKKRVPYKIVVECIDVEDFKKYSPIIQTQPVLDESNRSASMGWEVIDEVFDPSIHPASTDEIHKTKLNKYQGLENFAMKIVEDEKIKLQDVKVEKKNWIIPSLAFAIPKLLGSSENEKSTEKSPKNMLTESNRLSEINSAEKKQKKPNNFTAASRNVKRMQTLNVTLQIQSHFKRVSINVLNKKNFNKKFPIQKLQRSTSISNLIKDKNDEDISTVNKIAKRKFSFREISIKDKLDFINSLKNSLDSSKHSLLDQIYIKMEKVLSSKEIFKEEEEKKIDEKNELPKARKIGPWEELWEDKAEIIKKQSPYGHFPSYKLRCIIVKGGDDLRQEIICMQLFNKFRKIFQEKNLKLYLRPYEIIVTSANSGILEFIPNTIAIDGLKKKYPNTSLLNFYKMTWDFDFEEAQKNFVESLAANSLLCYFLQIKDRHNGNILIDSKGYILHIDFGFMLALSPGGINFESAPFKFTSEYLELMGGKNSNMFEYFKIIFTEGFKELRNHVHEFAFLLEIMMKGSDLPCFTNFSLDVFKARFKENYSEEECELHAEKLIDLSIDNWRTVQYDNFQKMTNGIMP